MLRVVERKAREVERERGGKRERWKERWEGGGKRDS